MFLYHYSPLRRLESVNFFKSMNTVLSLIPLHSASILCCLTQTKLQVWIKHRGHRYLIGFSPHTEHGGTLKRKVLVIGQVLCASQYVVRPKSKLLFKLHACDISRV